MSLYQYDNLPEAEDGLFYTRLITVCPGKRLDPVRCQIRTVQIRPGGLDLKYEALSYYWGDHTPAAVVFVGEESTTTELALHKSLYDAFIALRRPDSERTLWADAICINQGDVEERAAQVRIMHHIYRAASNVLIWLPKPYDYSPFWKPKRAFKLIEHFYKLSHEQPDMAVWDTSSLATLRRFLTSRVRHYGPKAGQCIRILFACNWFTRTWVIQEVACSKRATLVCCDGSSIDFKHFIRGMKFATEKRMFVIVTRDSALTRGNRKPASLSAAVQMDVIQNRRLDSSDGIQQYLFRFWGSQCSDPRDKIFALYGISELPHESKLATAFKNEELKPDYKREIPDLYVAAAKVCLTSGDLDILSRPIIHSNPEFNLPSWTPDWSVGTYLKSLGSLASTGTYHASRNSTASPIFGNEKECRLGGVQIGVIESLGTHESLLSLDSGYNDSFRKVLAMCAQLHTWYYQLVEWEIHYHHGSPTYPYTGEHFCQVYWSMFAATRLAYESQWFQPGLQTSFRGSSDKIQKVLKEGCQVDRFLPSKSVMEWIKWTGGLPNLITVGFRIGSLIRFAPYDQQIFLERNIFVSNQGHLGLCPANAAKGDRIVIPKGGKVPLILRPVPPGQEPVFNLVGDAYVHGVMQGEAFDEDACGPFVLV